MASNSFVLATHAWAIASGLAVAGIGGLSLLGGKTRPRGAMTFGLAAISWGVQIALANGANLLADPRGADALYALCLAFSLILPVLLVEFAASQVVRAHRGAWRAVRAGAIVVAVAGAILAVVAPHLFIEPAADAASATPRWGPLHPVFVVVPQFAAFGITLVAVESAFRDSATPRTAVRGATLMAGFGIYLGFAAGNSGAYDLLAVLAEGGDVDLVSATYIALFAGLCLLIARMAFDLWKESRASHVAGWTTERLLCSALLLPMVGGVIEARLVLSASTPGFLTVGLWRLAGVAIIAYGLARWRFYDLPRRTASAAATVGGVAAAGATGAAAYGAGAVLSSSPAVPPFLGLLALTAALVPSVRVVRRLFGFATARESLPAEDLYGQRLDAYRAALEATFARGTLDEDEAFLSALRERFHLSEPEDRVLRHYARGSVLVARASRAADVYERLRLLGEGAGGRTWLARDRARERLVVLKEPLDRWQRERGVREAVIREAQLAAKVRHPHVVAIEAIVQGDASPVIVMEHVEGGSLADLLRERVTLEPAQAIGLMTAVLAGLEAIHTAGIVHRDLKPCNILLTQKGEPKIADFGIAVPAGAPSLTSTPVLEGTTRVLPGTVYMAPEVRAGVTTSDRRSDVYACAVVLHECIHGRPLDRSTPPAHRPEAPPGLAAVLARAAAHRPEDRFPTARAFADALDALRG
jgi:hypothetical protein